MYLLGKHCFFFFFIRTCVLLQNCFNTGSGDSSRYFQMQGS
jgi:hypothetical protein